MTRIHPSPPPPIIDEHSITPLITEVMNMTPQQLRIVIGEARGWQFFADKEGFQVQECPNYPENIAEAWQLVEEEQQKQLYFDISAEADEAGTYFRVRVLNERRYYSYSYGSVVCRISAPTAPLAICRAWLLLQKIKKESRENGQ